MRSSTPKNKSKIDKKSNRIFHPSEGLTLASPGGGSRLSDYNEHHLKLPDRTHTETDEVNMSPRHEIAVGQSN